MLTENVAKLAIELEKQVKERHGYTIFITHGYRTTQEQQGLYAQGRTKPGNVVTYADGVVHLSDHQLGIAFDIAFRDGPLYPSDQNIRDNVGDIAYELGLKRGYREWDGFDKPHFRLESDRGIKIVEEEVDLGENIEDVDVEGIAKSVGKEYGLSSDIYICIATAETSLGKNVKSEWNWLNLGNHDSGETKGFDSLEHNFQYGGEVLTEGEHLSQWNNVAELSCGGRMNVLGWESCKPKNEDYFRASSDYNRHNNVTTCLSKRLGGSKEDYDLFEYKTGKKN